jgi:hypothetical protein
MQHFEGSANEENYSENYDDDPYGGEYDDDNMELNDYDQEDVNASGSPQQPPERNSDEFNKGSTLGNRVVTE